MELKEQHNKERDKSADGFQNRLEDHILTRYRPLWKFIQHIGPLNKFANRAIIDVAVRKTTMRPYPFASMPRRGNSDDQIADYTSWEALTDTNWFTRHLPVKLQKPDETRPPLPELSVIANLFDSSNHTETLSEKSTLLLTSFAQWFTDGFLMTDSLDRRKTHSTHHIDLNQLYGSSRKESDSVRLLSENSGKRGKLKYTFCEKSGETWAPYYFNEKGEVKPEFHSLRPPLRLTEFFEQANLDNKTQNIIKSKIFAFAGERANSTPYTSMINTLFLREHNRLAGKIEKANPDWDDERVFQTARNVNIVILIKIVLEEYINHLSPYHFNFFLDPSSAWRRPWNKPNWIPIEFNLLYRWHSMVPQKFDIGGRQYEGSQTLFNNGILCQQGLAKMMEVSSKQKARRLGLNNTPDFLVPVEILSVAQGRENKLASYNDYREAMSFGRATEFNQITGDPVRQELLKQLYSSVDEVEFFVGLFAEDVPTSSALPPLLGRMVGLDAFSQALTNPLLAENIFNPETFSAVGWDEIHSTNSLSQLVHRNHVAPKDSFFVSMAQKA
jgi:prostaglandin-endoperoxide synthase 2